MRERDERRDDSATVVRRAAGRTEPDAGPHPDSSLMDLGRPDSVLALQQLVGNAEVSRRVQRSAVENVLSTPGRPLDEPVRTDMETRLGADFSDVRVHTDGAAHESAESVNAEAYTSGTHIVFQRGRYDTASDTGRETLAHELSHVVQQRSGPVAGTDTGDGLAVSDPADRFEREAERVAAQAVAGEATDPVTATGSWPHHGMPVARMISVADFRRRTDKVLEWGRGDKISQVDNALAAYHAVPQDDYQGRLTQLGHVEQECRNYLTNSTNDRRKAEVTALLGEVTAHQAIYGALVSAGQQTDNTGIFRDLIRAQDAILAQLAQVPGADANHELSHFNAQVYDQMGQLRRQLQQTDLQALMHDDLQTLVTMSANPDVPQVTRTILTELLANQGIVEFQPASARGPGTRRTGPHQYALSNAPHHVGGTTERVGALAHELTHVDAGEAYQNTDILLLFRQGLSDTEIAQLVTRRRATLDNLVSLLDAHQGMSWAQRELFASKLNYAGAKSLGGYADSFLIANKIDQATHTRLKGIENLTAPNSAVLVEYDTVINQLLVYLHQWGVPQASPLYVEVLRVARQQRRERRNP
jgi:hypothetical protein